MTLPKKVANRLRLGREVAARVPASVLGNIGWVYVYPILDPANGYRTVGRGGETQFVPLGNGNPVQGFLVRHLEIDAHVADDFNESRRDDIGVPTADERIFAANEDTLENILRRWIIDLMSLRIPSDVGYLFERGPNLID
jgi:hypothetical protein